MNALAWLSYSLSSVRSCRHIHTHHPHQSLLTKELLKDSSLSCQTEWLHSFEITVLWLPAGRSESAPTCRARLTVLMTTLTSMQIDVHTQNDQQLVSTTPYIKQNKRQKTELRRSTSIFNHRMWNLLEVRLLSIVWLLQCRCFERELKFLDWKVSAFQSWCWYGTMSTDDLMLICTCDECWTNCYCT